MLVEIIGMVLWTSSKVKQGVKKIAELDEGIVSGHFKGSCIHK